jgi:hypothetical protein
VIHKVDSVLESPSNTWLRQVRWRGKKICSYYFVRSIRWHYCHGFNYKRKADHFAKYSDKLRRFFREVPAACKNVSSTN